MHILNTSLGNQSFSFLPRMYPVEVDVTVTDENTNVSYTFVNTPTVINGYMNVEDKFTFNESTFYRVEIKIKDEDVIIYRDRIFCTDQTDLNNFDITDGTTKTGYDKDNIIII